MHVDAALVRHVAGLARLDLAPAEVERLVPELARILGHVQQVAGLVLERRDEAALLQPMRLTDLRPDSPQEPLDVRALLAQAPASDGAFFVVPRFLGDGEPA